MQVTHHFLPNGVIYAKEIQLLAGEYVVKHTHDYDHFGVLTRGHVVLLVAGEPGRLVLPGPPTVVQAGREHTIRALIDSTWLCIHHTDVKDPERVDDTLVGGA